MNRRKFVQEWAEVLNNVKCMCKDEGKQQEMKV